MSHFDIRYHILSFSLCRISHFNIRNHILAFELGPNISSWYSKSYFDIRIQAEYRILTFEILFWHSNFGQISNLTFKILFWHSNSGRITYFYIRDPVLTFEFRNIAFWHSKCYPDVRTGWAKCHSFTYKIQFWHSKYNFDIQNTILTFKLGPNIEFWH